MGITRTLYTIVLIIVIAFAMSCSLQRDKVTGETGVAKFHSQFNAGQYHEIYIQTDDGFRKATSEQQLTEYMEAVHRKLGEVKDAKQVGWRVNFTTAGSQVLLAYRTTFAEGDATEEFVFIVNGNDSRLFKYNIQSPTLITK